MIANSPSTSPLADREAARRWALQTLGAPDDLAPEAVGPLLVGRLEECAFVPSPSGHEALLVAAHPESFERVWEAERGAFGRQSQWQLREEADELARRFFDLAPSDRRGRFEALWKRCGEAPLARQRLVELRPGLDFDRTPPADASEEEKRLLGWLCELFVMRPAERGGRREAILQEVPSVGAEWHNAALRLAGRCPVAVQLDGELFIALGAGLGPSLSYQGAVAGAAPGSSVQMAGYSVPADRAGNHGGATMLTSTDTGAAFPSRPVPAYPYPQPTSNSGSNHLWWIAAVLAALVVMGVLRFATMPDRQPPAPTYTPPPINIPRPAYTPPRFDPPPYTPSSESYGPSVFPVPEPAATTSDAPAGAETEPAAAPGATPDIQRILEETGLAQPPQERRPAEGPRPAEPPAVTEEPPFDLPEEGPAEGPLPPGFDMPDEGPPTEEDPFPMDDPEFDMPGETPPAETPPAEEDPFPMQEPDFDLFNGVPPDEDDSFPMEAPGFGLFDDGPPAAEDSLP